MNACPDEVIKFDKLASQWWDPAGPLKTLHDINPLRLDFVKKQINISGQKLLDVGCGGGILSESLAKAGAQVTGIDLSAAALHAANTHQQDLDINYKETSVEALALQEPASFSVITCMELLEHVPSPASIIEACATLLRPGGMLLVSTLNRHPKAYLLGILAAEYVVGIVPKGTHDYEKFIRPSELTQWGRDASLNVKNITGMRYNPLSQTYRLSHDIQVNYFMALQKENLV